MGIAIVPYTAGHTGALQAFNRRLAGAGISYRFPEDVPVGDAAPVRTRAFVAVEGGESVRGGYLIQEQTCWMNGRECTAAFLRLPLSEGLIRRQFSMVGAQLLAHASQQQPLLFGLGIGSREETFAKLVLALGWQMAPVPFLFKVLRPFRVARGLEAIRRTAWRRRALDLAAFSGVAAIGARLATRRASAGRRAGPTPERGGLLAPLDETEHDCTALWERHRSDYRFVARRDADAVRQLYPAGSRFLRWAYRRGAGMTGWVIALDTAMQRHAYFGDLRVGTIVDCFGDPEDAGPMLTAAVDALRRRGVDLIVSNQSAPIWIGALEAAGCSRHASNYLFAASPALRRDLHMADVDVSACHLTRGDGDGPVNL